MFFENSVLKNSDYSSYPVQPLELCNLILSGYVRLQSLNFQPGNIVVLIYDKCKYGKKVALTLHLIVLCP